MVLVVLVVLVVMTQVLVYLKIRSPSHLGTAPRYAFYRFSAALLEPSSDDCGDHVAVPEIEWEDVARAVAGTTGALGLRQKPSSAVIIVSKQYK